MVLFNLMLALSLGQASEYRCMNAYGTAECGYHCTAAYGQIQCAQTPWGACEAAYGQVVCADPPSYLTDLGYAGHELAQMECRSAFGTIRCGYQCTQAFGQLACAETPWGSCQAQYGQVICFDGGRTQGAWGTSFGQVFPNPVYPNQVYPNLGFVPQRPRPHGWGCGEHRWGRGFGHHRRHGRF